MILTINLVQKIARRIEVQEDDWIESGKYGDTYKQTIIVDGTHKVIKVDAPDTKGNYIGSAYEYDGQTFGDLLDVLNYIDASLSLANAVAVAEKETDTTPTEKQKEAGNYKRKAMCRLVHSISPLRTRKDPFVVE